MGIMAVSSMPDLVKTFSMRYLPEPTAQFHGHDPSAKPPPMYKQSKFFFLYSLWNECIVRGLPEGLLVTK